MPYSMASLCHIKCPFNPNLAAAPATWIALGAPAAQTQTQNHNNIKTKNIQNHNNMKKKTLYL